MILSAVIVTQDLHPRPGSQAMIDELGWKGDWPNWPATGWKYIRHENMGLCERLIGATPRRSTDAEPNLQVRLSRAVKRVRTWNPHDVRRYRRSGREPCNPAKRPIAPGTPPSGHCSYRWLRAPSSGPNWTAHGPETRLRTGRMCICSVPERYALPRVAAISTSRPFPGHGYRPRLRLQRPSGPPLPPGSHGSGGGP